MIRASNCFGVHWVNEHTNGLAPLCEPGWTDSGLERTDEPVTCPECIEAHDTPFVPGGSDG